MTRSATKDRFTSGARIGDYVVDREVAYETAAIVYYATHVVLPRKAHVKVSHPGSRTAAVQLLREACILEALSHPGAPRVYELGVLADRRPWSSIEQLPASRSIASSAIARPRCPTWSSRYATSPMSCATPTSAASCIAG